MKELTVVLAVVMLSVGVSCGSVPDREAKANASSVTKDETTPGTPWLPFFGLNPFQSFTLPGLGLAPKPNTDPVKIKATKTQYIEVCSRKVPRYLGNLNMKCFFLGHTTANGSSRVLHDVRE